jgi:hypothetical protein
MGSRGYFPENYQDRHAREVSGMFLRNSDAKHVAIATGVFCVVSELRAAKSLPVGRRSRAAGRRNNSDIRKGPIWNEKVDAAKIPAE